MECQGGVVVDDRRPPQPIGCRVGCRENRPLRPSTHLYISRAVSRGICRALQLYNSRYASTALQLYSALHSTTSAPTLCRKARRRFLLRPSSAPRIELL